MSRVKQVKPKIIRRSEWQARPGGGTVYANPAAVYYRGTLHHDASFAYPHMTDAQAAQRMRDHQHTHQVSRGWSDLGYHYGIAPSGTIFEGRPLNRQGAHTLNRRDESENYGNVGIFLFGNFQEQNPTHAQMVSAISLWAWLCWYLDMDPNKFKGHRDYDATACPGTNLYPKISDIISESKDRLKSSSVMQPTIPNPSVTLDGERMGDAIIMDGANGKNITYVPVRILAEALDLIVDWDGATKTVHLKSKGGD